MNDDFYRALEDRFRGSRDLVKERLRVYLPAVVPRARARPGPRVFDVGCGRGEWLELLGEEGVPAYGMDLAADMLAACAELGLAVHQGNAIAHLQTLPPASLLVVSGFHVAEHLAFAELRALLAAARRALVPEGLLILETPNPENLVVGTASFHLDPTHRQPLPADLLAYLVGQAGFAHIEHLRLQHEPRLADMAESVRLHDVLAGVSPDYAIVASPAAGVPKLGAGEAAGVSLAGLAGRYDDALRRRLAALRDDTAAVASQIAGLQAQAAAAEAQATIAEAQAAIAKTQAAAAAAEAREARTEAAAVRIAAEQAAAAARWLREQLAALHASRSWRITRPLRWLMRQWRARVTRH